MVNFHSAGEVPGMICHLVQYLVFKITCRRVNRFTICLKILLGHQMTFLTVYITYSVLCNFTEILTGTGTPILTLPARKHDVQSCSDRSEKWL